MSYLKLFSASALLVFLIGCQPGGNDSAAAQSNVISQPAAPTQASTLKNYEPILQLEELTDANAANLLIQQGGKSFVVAYSSKEGAAQNDFLDMVVRESHNYTGAVKFYRLDQAKYPTAWSNITNGRTWTKGPCYLLVNNSPLVIGTIMDTVNGVDVPVHNLTSARLNAEIARLFKVQLPVSHVNIDNVDQKVLAPALPTLIMAYRNKGPNHDPVEFQRFVYESQLYVGRVNFVFVDLDQDDISTKLGIKLPKQDDAYFVVYDPTKRNGSMAFDPNLSTTNMEVIIRTYFGPGHEPAKVVP